MISCGIRRRILSAGGPRYGMMSCSMADAGSYPARTRGGTRQLQPVSLLRAPLAEKHLDAALLVVVRSRKLEQSVLPGVPFH